MSTLCVLVPPSPGSARNATDGLSKRDALQPFQSLMGCIGAGQGAGSCDWAAVVEHLSMKQVREQALVAGGGANVTLALAGERQ